MRNMTWRRKRLKSAGILGWAMMTAGAAAVVFSLAATEAKGIPGWEPVNGAVHEALAAEEAAVITADPVILEEEVSDPIPSDAASPQPQSSADANPGSDSLPQGSAVPATSGSPLLDLNAASEEELDALPGIGPAKARAIIAYRESGRTFRSVDDLLEVKGIGPKLLEQIRPFVRAGNPGDT